MSIPTTVSEYLQQVAPERKEAMTRLVDIIRTHLPSGFEETISYGMIGWVVPLSLYPSGYHVSPNLPLPFINLASQKRHIALYHMGIYSFPAIQSWFIKAYPEHCRTKLDMGKSCIRFRNVQHIPYALIGELCSKVTPEEWIARYESRK